MRKIGDVGSKTTLQFKLKGVISHHTMPRQPRLDAPGALHHVMGRGIERTQIFRTDRDREDFLNRLADLCAAGNFIIYAWSLMSNHFHLLVRQEVDGGITKFMKKLGVGYSMFFNIKYQRKGALFGGLFKSKLIGVDDNYMKQLLGYIHLNPLDIKFPDWENKIDKSSDVMKKFIESYPYSSYPDYIGENRTAKNIIKPKNFPDYFDDIKSFKDFVENYFVKA